MGAKGRTVFEAYEPMLALLQRDIECCGDEQQKARRRLILRGVRSTLLALNETGATDRLGVWLRDELFPELRYGEESKAD
ncbi:hypothetical protein D9M68_940290 [compost metagenome]